MKVYRFVDDAYSHWYMHQADVVIDKYGNCVKHRDRPGGRATAEEINACVDITPAMCRAKRDEIDIRTGFDA